VPIPYSRRLRQRGAEADRARCGAGPWFAASAQRRLWCAAGARFMNVSILTHALHVMFMMHCTPDLQAAPRLSRRAGHARVACA